MYISVSELGLGIATIFFLLYRQTVRVIPWCDQTQVFSPAQPKQRTSFLWLYASHCACVLCAAQSFKIHCSQIFVVACKHTSPFMNQHNQYCLQTWFQIPQYNCHYNCNNNFRYKTNIVLIWKRGCLNKILDRYLCMYIHIILDHSVLLTIFLSWICLGNFINFF